MPLHPLKTRAAWPPLLLVGLALPLFTFGLGSYGLVNSDEAIYHRIALGMVESGDCKSSATSTDRPVLLAARARTFRHLGLLHRHVALCSAPATRGAD